MAKVLLVEDDNNLREIYEARLQAEGYTIVSAQDGEEALVVAKNELPDLIISDVMMPKISGFEMLDILRNTDGLKEVKVIMLTALGQSDDQQRADRLGADRYLVKSQVTLEDIVKVSHELLEDNAAAPAPEAAPAPAPAVPEPVAMAVAPAPEPVATPTAPEPVAPVVVTVPAEPVAPNPVVPTPAPAPVAVTSMPEPVATPIVDSGAVASAETAVTAETVQSASQEEATVEAKIEDFVSGASSEAAPAVAPETVASSVDDAAAVADDKVMSTALDNLAASAPELDTSVAPVTSAPTVAPAPALVPVAATPLPATEDTEATANGQVEIAHKKIISPLDTEPKKDINTLLAIEEAREAATAPPAPPTAIVAEATGPATAAPLGAVAAPVAGMPLSEPPVGIVPSEQPAGLPAAPVAVTPPPAPGSGGIDPNSIAL